MTWRDLRSLIIEALRASDFEPIMKNMNIIHDRSKRASVLFRKWKGGRDDESILKEKWLTFKRPLTRRDKPFYLEEGLLWALQQEGWLFPYKAEWYWTIYSDDPRLKEK